MSALPYLCDDGNAEAEIFADSPEAAARAYCVEHLSESTTYWVRVHVSQGGEELDDVKVTVDPSEPTCAQETHLWGSERVSGHNGGVQVSETCSHCGVRKVWTNRGQDPLDGEELLHSITYHSPEPDYDMSEDDDGWFEEQRGSVWR